MAEKTEIAWTDSTFNPWIGCSKVSPGCDHCYAERDFDLRRGRAKWGPGNPRSRTSAANWQLPLQWSRSVFVQCVACGHRGEPLRAIHVTPLCEKCRGDTVPARRRVFCASLADVFDNEVPAQWRYDLFDLIGRTSNLDWLLLTKRIGNAAKMLPWTPDGAAGCLMASNQVWPNVWIGATIVNQEEADRDIPKLLALPAQVRFLSMEPLLGPVDLTWCKGEAFKDAAGSERHHPFNALGSHGLGGINWVIVGGESGPKARPFNIEWARSIAQQCQVAGVPVFVKQMGARPVWSEQDDGIAEPPFWGRIKYMDRSGSDWSEWPDDLRVREFPHA